MRGTMSDTRSSGVRFSELANNPRHNILLVDLNNFASFPTLAIGILIAALRNAGHSVQLIVPLAYDVPGSMREKPDTRWTHLARKLHHSTAPGMRWVRDTARRLYYAYRHRPHATVLREVGKALDRKPDLLLLSVYLMHYPTVVELCARARSLGVPVIVGGPALNLPDVAKRWRDIPGVTALYGGEADIVLPEIVHTLLMGGDISSFPGVVPGKSQNAMIAAPPLRELDRSPTPDFTDFAWDRYPVRIVPIMTGRGCQWGRCVFCSDVVSANGRTFRTRSLENVMMEIREQSRRYATNNFLFLDLKLNSHPALFRGIAERIQIAAPGAQWIGTVHVDTRSDNGLSARDLKNAANAGMRRISFGLETASPRLLDLMDKGTSIEAIEAFVRHASEAGLSVRATMFRGFPGETADDLAITNAFLMRHSSYIDRIRFNDFSVPEETPIWFALRKQDPKYPDTRLTGTDHRSARANYVSGYADSAAYRRAKSRLLATIHAINRRPLRPEAQMFDGLM